MPKAKLSKDTKPSFSYLIEKKRDGGEFTTEEIRFIVDSILDEEMPEFQQAAWVMATFFQGMSAQETAYFAEEMMLSGEVIEMMDVSRPKIEKYSTGGVGDKTSLVLGPLAAAAGVAIARVVIHQAKRAIDGVTGAVTQQERQHGDQDQNSKQGPPPDSRQGSEPCQSNPVKWQ